MIKSLKFASAAVLATALASTASAQSFSADFETDQSANFTVLTIGPSVDSFADFQFNTSTFAFTNPAGAFPTAGDVVTSPGSGSGNTVLKLTTNLNDSTALVGGVADTVIAYPTVTGLGAEWDFYFDVWLNYNGPATGGSGSTNMFFFGATDATTVTPGFANPTGTGFYLTMTQEGGAAADYRTYIGSGTIAQTNAATNWLGAGLGTAINNTNANWTTFFPNTGFPATTPSFETAGAPGKRWLSVKLSKIETFPTSGIYDAIVSFKRYNESTYTQVGVTAGIPASSNFPFIAYGDINNTRPTTAPAWAEENAAFVDAINIQTRASSVNDWMMLQD